MRLRKIDPKHIWQLKFNDYAEAKSAQEFYNNLNYSEIQGGFNSIEWQGKQQKMLELAFDGKLPRYTILPELLPDLEIQNLIDYGGGPGWIWAYLVKMNLASNISYFNVELESSRIPFESMTRNLPRMKFMDLGELPDFHDSKTLLYFNSILQYFEDNSELIKIVKKIKPIQLVLDDVAGSAEEFYSLQNYYGFLQINRFLSIEKLITQVCELGYSLSVQRVYTKVFPPQMVPKIWLGSKESSSCEIPSSWTLVFNRI